MMISIELLESTDTVTPDDWCRPLNLTTMNGGHSDYYSFTSQYSGRPENNVKWVQVKYILGKPWHGKTVAQINRALSRYEFVRGEIPRAHRLSHQGLTDYSKVFRQKEDKCDDDIPF